MVEKPYHYILSFGKKLITQAGKNSKLPEKEQGWEGGVATWLGKGWAVTDCRGELLQPVTSLSDDRIKKGLPHGGVPPVVGLLRVGIVYTVPEPCPPLSMCIQ